MSALATYLLHFCDRIGTLLQRPGVRDRFLHQLQLWIDEVPKSRAVPGSNLVAVAPGEARYSVVVACHDVVAGESVDRKSVV